MPRKHAKVSSEVLKSDKAQTRVSGRGDYSLKTIVPKGTFSKLGASAGAALGAAAGTAAGGGFSVPGGIIGGELGRRAGDYLAKVVGFGDYRVKENSLLTTGYSVPPDVGVPVFVSKTGSMMVRHREYVKDVVVPAVPATFTLESFEINPGNPGFFPWLSTIAVCFQQYRIHGMIVEFRSLSSDISSGGALGAIILGTNYNVNAATFATKQEMEASEFASSTKPSMSQLHAIECNPDQTTDPVKFVRIAATDANSALVDDDDRLYDLGTFQLATQGLPGSAGATLGELWVSYEVEFFKNAINPSNACGVITGTTGVTTTEMLGTDPSFEGGFGCLYDTTTQARFGASGSFVVCLTTAGTPSANLLITFPDSLASSLWFGGTTYVYYKVKAKIGDRIIPTPSKMTVCNSMSLKVMPFPYAWA